LYLACDRARKPHHLIKITKAKQSDILTWKMFLENFNGFPNKDQNTICLTSVITLSDFDVQEFKISTTD
jgi:hypothetical protein